MSNDATGTTAARRWLTFVLAIAAAGGSMVGAASGQQPSTPAPPPASAPAKPSPSAPAPAAAPGGALTGAVGETQAGLAAYYSDRLKGRPTASGERYNPSELTTAHQTLPFGTKVKITNPKNNKSVVVRVNDRGPTQANRICDVSGRAARELGIGKGGMAEVKLEVVEAAKPKPEKKKKAQSASK